MPRNNISVDEMNQKMTIIGNIRSMQEVVGDRVQMFEDLVTVPYEELQDVQESLIPRYNEAVNCNN